MSTSEAQAAPPRPIRNARTLFEMLRSAEPATRAKALRAIQDKPEAAIAFGLQNGRDVVDVLLAEAIQYEGTLEWLNWAATLSHFRDSRVGNFFGSVLSSVEEPTTLFTAANYLATGAVISSWKSLTALLLQNNCPARARAVAPLIKASPNLTAADRIRIRLLVEDSAEMPIDESTVDAWCAELAGPFRQEACAELEAQGEAAWALIASRWQQLTEEDQFWLLGWGSSKNPQIIANTIQHALSSGTRRVRMEALRALSGFEEHESIEPIRALLIPLLQDEDLIVRHAAVFSAPSDVDWRALLRHERHLPTRQAALAQLVKAEGARAIPDLLEHLRDNNWQIRATASDLLVNLGDAVVEPVKSLVQDPDQNVRVAAVRILLDLEQDHWLEQEILLPQDNGRQPSTTYSARQS